MTAVEAPRSGAGTRARPPGGAPARPTGPSAGATRRWTPTRVAAIAVVLAMVVGGLGAFAVALSAGGRYQSSPSVLFTSVDQEDNISSGSRYVQDRVDSWAQVASSDAVRARAQALSSAPGGPGIDLSGVSILAVAPSGTELLRITVRSDDAATVGAAGGVVAQAVADVVTSTERLPGLPTSRVSGTVVDPGATVTDVGLLEAQWWAVLGVVGGFVLALTACTFLRPGRWAADVGTVSIPDRDRVVDVNARAMGNELQALVAGLRTRTGAVVVGSTLVAVAGFGATGSMIFPLLLVLAAAVHDWRRCDARWSVAALVFTGAGIFPEKVDIVRLGPVTPTVLELSLLLALVLALRSVGSRPRTVFAAPVLAVVGAVLVGSVVALVRGGDFSSMIDSSRAMLIVVAFFPVVLAFGRRPHQLVAALLAIAGFCSSVIIIAAFAGVDRLVVNERSTVLTGEQTASVARLLSPVLDLWAPLLILLLSALVPRRPRWLWVALVVIGVLHQALSFNRSTWVPLILLVVAVAAITHGLRGVLRRAGVLTVVGAIGLALAFGGLLGGQGRAIADRASSVVTGQAYGEDSLPDRLRENLAAEKTLVESPWVGTGVGQPYGGELISYDSLHSRVVVDQRPYIHNQYLRIWLFMGVLGLLAFAFAGVRILALTWTAWSRRAAGWPMVVALAMGLACLAAQSILQTTLVSRPTVLTIATLMAAAAAFAVWRPDLRDPAASADASSTSTPPAPAGRREV